MITYIIEIPQPDQFAQLLTVWEASVRATHSFVTEEKIQLFKRLIQEQKLFEQSDVFCVRHPSGDVAGFAGVSGDSLDMLFLDPLAFGTGAGKTLMRHAIDIRGIKRLDVNEENQNALGFYEHFGFVVIGRSETDDNGEPFPLLHMSLKD